MILITAPTSNVGAQVLDRLVGAAELRIVARDPSRVPQSVRAQVDVLTGTHSDPNAIDAALDGADTVFWLVPPNGQANDVVEYYQQFTAPFCNAATRRGVKRIVYVTTLGRGYPHGAGLLSGAFAMDELIERTGLAYRALRMPFFMENFLGQVDAIKSGAFYLPNDPERTLLTVATRDIADVAARELDNEFVDQESVPVIGPDNLTPEQMAEVMSDVVGWKVRAERVPAEQYKTTMTGYGLSDGFARGLVDMAAAQDKGIYDNDAAEADRTATSFRQWCDETLSPALRD